MSEHVNEVQQYIDEEGQHRWRVVVTPGTPGGTEDDVIAVSSQGYSNKNDCAQSFYRLFFADWNDSFLAFYNEWNPEAGQVEADEVLEPPVNITASADPSDKE